MMSTWSYRKAILFRKHGVLTWNPDDHQSAAQGLDHRRLYGDWETLGSQQIIHSRKLTWKPKRSPKKITVLLKWVSMLVWESVLLFQILHQATLWAAFFFLLGVMQVEAVHSQVITTARQSKRTCAVARKIWQASSGVYLAGDSAGT